jgi:hypothetical protein
MSENPTFVEMQDEILRLRAALTDALEVMELIEDITGEWVEFCPLCQSYDDDRYGSHKHDCKLVAQIERLKLALHDDPK